MRKAVADWIKEYLQYLDVLLAFAGGLTVAILGWLDVLDGDQLTQATVAVLSVVALSLLHDRISRERRLGAVEIGMSNLKTEVTTTKTDLTEWAGEVAGRISSLEDTLRQSVQEIQSDFPYRHLAVSTTWDLKTRDLAHMTKIKTIRFTRNNVVAITDRGETTGEATNYEVFGGRPGEAPVQFDLLGAPSWTTTPGQSDWRRLTGSGSSAR
jgi:hypothetical protein